MNIAEVFAAHVREKYRTQAAAAKVYGCSCTFVNLVIHGRKQPNAAMLKDMGLEKRVVYIKAEK